MTKKNRVVALLLAVLVAFVLLSSMHYVVAEADHDCCGEHCTICYRIALCENILRTLGMSIGAAAFAVVVCRTVSALLPMASVQIFCATPVTLKVKLSN